jgi:hypothetical protein
MSYSFANPCWGCKLSETCTDHKVIQEAIDKIHSTNQDAGHKGGGCITLMCCNLQNENEVF